MDLDKESRAATVLAEAVLISLEKLRDMGLVITPISTVKPDCRDVAFKMTEKVIEAFKKRSDYDA